MIPKFPSTYSRLLARELRLDGEGVTTLLSGSGVSADDLFRLDGRIGPGDQVRIIENALELSRNPGFGLQVGSHMPHAAHGPLGVAIYCAPTLRHSIEVVERFQRIRVPVVAMTHHVHGEDLVIEVHIGIPLDDVGLFLTEVLIASMDGVLDGATASYDDPGEVMLGYPPPPHAEQYALWLRRPFTFGHRQTTIRVPAACRDAPNPFADPTVYEQAVRQCERVEADLRSHETWRGRVTRLLREHPGQLWTSEDVASALHVSVRSLARHLGAEGTTYQQSLDEELRRQAQAHLETPGHTVASVAHALGYHDVSAFRRAFKRWVGQTPQAWLSSRRN